MVTGDAGWGLELASEEHELRAWGKLGAVARAVLFALIPGAGVAGGLALAPLLGGAGVAAFHPSLVRQVFEKKPLPILFLIAFCLWAILSTLWTCYPDHIQAPKLAAIVGLGLLFAASAFNTPESARLTRAGALAAFLVLALMLGIEAIWDLPFNRASQPDALYWKVQTNPARGVDILMGLGWGVAAALLRWRAGAVLAAAAALALMGVFSTQFDQLAHLAGFILGVGGFALGFALPRLAPWLISSAIAAWMLAAPFALPVLLGDTRLIENLPFSLASRIGIWNYVCARISEAPLIGHGLDASRAVTDTIMVQGVEQAAVSLHPHSASLQIWFETGFIGAALASAALVFGGRALSRSNDRARSAAVCGCLASFGFIANFSYGLWQEWWIATFCLAAAVAGAVGGAGPRG